MISDSVVVSGIGVISPFGDSMSECLDNMHKNIDTTRDNIRTVIRLPEIIETDQISQREKKRHNRLSLMVTEAINRCLVDAGVQPEEIAGLDAGIVTASYFGCLSATDSIYKSMRSNIGRNAVNPIEFAKATHSFPASIAMTKFGMKGPVAALVSSFSVGLDAIYLANRLIRSGKANRIFIIAYEEIPSLAENNLKAIGLLNDDITAISSSPFCEGCVALLLEKAGSNPSYAAKSRKARLGTVKARCIDRENVVKNIRDNVLAAGIRESNRQATPMFIKHSARTDEERQAEDAALDSLQRDGVLGKTVNMKSWAGDYLGASGPMELGLAISSLKQGDSRFYQADDEWTPGKEVDLFVNSFDFRGNVTTASVTVFNNGEN